MEIIERYISDLKSHDEEKRRQAVKFLGELRDRKLINTLIEAMGDQSWRVRKEATEAVLSFRDPDVVWSLIPGLRDGSNAGLRNSVLEAIIRIGPEAVPAVAGLLKDEDQDVRKFAADILGGIETPETIPLLIAALDDEEENVVATSAEYLGKRGDRRAIPPLLRLLKKDGFWIRFCALRAIGFLADEELEDEILPYLEDKELRKEAIDVLSRIGSKESFSRLTGIYPLSGPKERIRIMGALAGILGRISDRDAGSARDLIAILVRADLGDALADHIRENILEGNREKRMLAVTIAGYFPSPSIMEALVGLILDSDEEDDQWEAVCRSISEFPEEYLSSLFPYLISESTITKRKIARILGYMQYAPSLPKILPLVHDEDGHVRASIAVSLGHIGDKSAIMPLCNLLGDPYPDVREAAVRALLEMAPKDESANGMIKEIILSSLEEDNEMAREACLMVLAELADISVIPLFKRFLKDTSARVRKVALSGLGRLNTDHAMDIILTALTDEDPDIRTEAIRHLGNNGGGKYRNAVAAMVSDEDDAVAAEALRSLTAFSGEDPFEILRLSARESSGLKQLAAIRALCSLSGRRVLDAVMQVFPKGSNEVKKEVIRYVGKAGHSDHLQFIINHLEDPDWSIRIAAVEAISSLGDLDAVALLKEKYYPGEADAMVRRAMESTFEPVE